MKSDNSRNTFDARKHFSSVRMQQGRVQIDADSNEQNDIVNHRVDTEAGDVIGLCGAPMHDPGFHIVKDVADLSTEEREKRLKDANTLPPAGFKVPFKPPDFLISAGRYYVDGILCENERLISYLNQADLPNATRLAKGSYLVYLDVWQRLITALDDPSIREIALGGPDTATRAKTVRQVKCWPVVDDRGQPFDGGNCLTRFDGFEKLIAPSDGKLVARTQQQKPSTDACIVAPGAGYRGLENQLYRIEIHDAGGAVDVKADRTGAPAIKVANNQIRVTGAWAPEQAIEIFSSKPTTNPMNTTLAYITKAEPSAKPDQRARKVSQILTLDIDVPVLTDLNIRGVKATLKWSRDNGVVVTTINPNGVNGQDVAVHDLGPDDTLGFKEGQWVEIIDDGLELNGLPGQLAQITKIDSAISVITLSVAPSLVLDMTLNPKLRRWDGIGAVKYDSNAPNDSFIDLESGVQVRFFEGQFNTGDYWTFPARTATADTESGNIEWPQDGNKNPLEQLPFGIKHHYCRLAMLHYSGSAFDVVQDCRKLFPPITELTSLVYVNGAGQESMPGHPQPQALQVGVFNGQWPVPDARVRFTASDKGQLAADITGLPVSMTATNTSAITVASDANGVASCAWTLNPDVTKPSQQVEARLLDANGDPMPAIVRFDGNLSIAAEVFYDPSGCGTLKDQITVQKALSRLSQLVSLYKISGDAQLIMPDETVILKVLTASPCGPVSDSKFKPTFKIVSPGTGTITAAELDKDGFWTASWKPNWTPDPTKRFQEVEATITDDASHTTTPPTAVRFSVNLSTADHVSFDPGACPTLEGQNTVQKALSRLSQLASLYKISGDGQQIVPGKPLADLKVLVASPCGPVRDENFKVTFNTVDPGKGTVTNVTGKDGFWTCTWTPDLKTPFQEVEATIKDDAAHTTTPPTAVRFSANLGASNVEPGIKITGVFTESKTDPRQPLDNDTLVDVSRIANGIKIECEADIAPVSVGEPPRPPSSFRIEEKPTCFLTLDLPYPLSQADRSLWGSATDNRVLGFQPLILDCDVRVDGRVMRWIPTPTVNDWLQKILFTRLLQSETSTQLLARLTLKGNFIFSNEAAARWLDGHVFGKSDGKRIDLVFPGGSEKGGDFEMWFWLFQPTPPPPRSLVLDVSTTPNILAAITGTVRVSVRDNSGAVVSNATVTLTGTQLTGFLRTGQTDAQGVFLFRIIPSGTYSVSVLTSDGLSAQKQGIVV